MYLQEANKAWSASFAEMLLGLGQGHVIFITLVTSQLHNINLDI